MRRMTMVAAVVAMTAIGGCASAGKQMFAQPEVSVKDVKVTGLGLAGGSVDCFSCSASGRARHGIWSTLTRLNERHMLFAWLSLVSVALTDLYVRELACGAIRDIRFF